MATPTEALTKLLEQHRGKPQGLKGLMRPRMPGIINSADYEPLKQPGAAEAFLKVTASLTPKQCTAFALSLSRNLPASVPLQQTLAQSFAVANDLPWDDAYMILNHAHLHVHPAKPDMHKVVVDQLIRLEERSDPEVKEAVTHMLKTMPGAPYLDV